MMIPDLAADCDTLMRSRIRNYPCRVNRASSIGDICERRLVYERTHWQDKKPHDVGLEYVFQVGHTLETPVIRMLQDAGYQIIREQEPFEYISNGETLCSGHVDGVICKGEYTAVLEVKTMSPHVLDRIETVDDFQRYEWTAKYPAQLNLYEFGLEILLGVWVLINKATGRPKFIHTELDYGFAETILQKCERINRHVKENTLPDFLQGCPETCERCAFFDICNPPVEREPVEIKVDSMLIKDVEEMQSLQESSGRYERLKKELKEKLESSSTKKSIIGRWMYESRPRTWTKRWTEITEERSDA